ncbi:MAG: ATP-binding protein [Bacteroidales bacterium]|nr:ATP-binding protein [Bacteroidales bacterium]
MIFKRKLYDDMLRWKQERNGATALLIEGARRVGKSTLVESFAKSEYKSYILIDFSHKSKDIDHLFEDMFNLNNFFLSLQTLFNVTLYKRNSVIIFDEVQNQPLARQAIKHLVKDGRYDYIETGSLISIKRNVQNILIPSEEQSLTLHPMDFEEFLWAMGKENGLNFVRIFYEQKKPLGVSHRTIMHDLRLYMLVGGMPQSVDTYLEYNNMQKVDAIKRDILKLYDTDFRKIDPSGRASMMFKNIPAQLNTNASRYMIETAIKERRTDNIDIIVSEMRESKVVNLAFHTTDPNVGLGMHRLMDAYKMFIADTGLFIALAFWDKKYTDNIIYQKLLFDKLEANLGYIYENLVAQMLYAAGNELYYYTFPTNKGNTNYEVDFLISKGNKICPIEVKSSGYKSHKSLDAFSEKYHSRIGEKFLVYTKDYVKDGDTTCLPVYMTGLM